MKEFLEKAREYLQIPLTIISESKKVRALIAGLVVVLAGKIGLDFSEAEVLGVIGLICSYIVGQGVADMGKEKAKVEATERTVLVGKITEANLADEDEADSSGPSCGFMSR